MSTHPWQHAARSPWASRTAGEARRGRRRVSANARFRCRLEEVEPCRARARSGRYLVDGRGATCIADDQKGRCLAPRVDLCRPAPQLKRRARRPARPGVLTGALNSPDPSPPAHLDRGPNRDPPLRGKKPPPRFHDGTKKSVAERYRREATRIRLAGMAMCCDWVRQQMFSVADQYDGLAEFVEDLPYSRAGQTD